MYLFTMIWHTYNCHFYFSCNITYFLVLSKTTPLTLNTHTPPLLSRCRKQHHRRLFKYQCNRTAVISMPLGRSSPVSVSQEKTWWLPLVLSVQWASSSLHHSPPVLLCNIFLRMAFISLRTIIISFPDASTQLSLWRSWKLVQSALSCMLFVLFFLAVTYLLLSLFLWN